MIAPDRVDDKGRKVYKQAVAMRVAGRYVCAECGGGLLTEATLSGDASITFDYEAVYCQHHPTAEFKPKWRKK